MYLPPEVWESLPSFNRSFDRIAEQQETSREWQTLVTTIEEWGSSHNANETTPVLTYYDGGTFVRIEDCRRLSSPQILTLDGVGREVFLFCQQIRTLDKVKKHFCELMSEEEIEQTLDALNAEKIIFREDNKVLALTLACEPIFAARRIRRHNMNEDASSTAHTTSKNALQILHTSGEEVNSTVCT
jgi:hypothetical protein